MAKKKNVIATKKAVKKTSKKKGTKKASGSPLQKYLDKALAVLKKFKISTKDEAPVELIRLLEEVRHLDAPKVLAIAKTIKYMGTFNAMVRDNVEDIRVGNRYLEITQLFDSIRDDSKRLIAQLDDGKISVGERASNLWMHLRRGSPHRRFEKIVDVYKEVTADTKKQLERELLIMDGYIDFRFSVKEAEILARELLEVQVSNLTKAKAALAKAQQAVEDAKDAIESKQSRLEMARDEAHRKYQDEDRNYQLLKDIAENLSIGYDVGETLITKLKQTHDVKDQVYRRAVTFFTTNEHVFTILSAVYGSQHGLHETTQATQALRKGAGKGLEDVAELGRKLEREALKAGYGSTIEASSVEKLVTAISDFQVESLNMIADLRKQSDENSREIRRVVEDGKRRYQETLAKFALEGTVEGKHAK